MMYEMRRRNPQPALYRFKGSLTSRAINRYKHGIKRNWPLMTLQVIHGGGNSKMAEVMTWGDEPSTFRLGVRLRGKC